MVNTIYYAKIGEQGYKICLIDYRGYLLANAQIPKKEFEVYIGIMQGHLETLFENEFKTELKELTPLKYDKLLQKAIKKLDNSGLTRETIEGYDPTNQIKN